VSQTLGSQNQVSQEIRRRVFVTNHWKIGESCVLRGIVNNHVWLAQSVVVVEDKPEETILLLMPGAQCAYPEGYWRWRKNKDYSHGTRWQEAQGDEITLREFTWERNRILMFLEPSKFYANFLFWDHSSGEFTCYYVNFQLPYQRSHCGFDTLDLDLDIVIDAQYNWQWKDEDEYQDGIREGGIQAEWVKEIENSQKEVFDRINMRSYPLDGSWLDWQPKPTWLPPKLPARWRIV
jgi:protein associated with RNAse G/E